LSQLGNPAGSRPDEVLTLNLVLFTKKPEAFSASGTWIELTNFDYSEDGITWYWLPIPNGSQETLCLMPVGKGLRGIRGSELWEQESGHRRDTFWSAALSV
jgi:hypothetical protein